MSDNKITKVGNGLYVGARAIYQLHTEASESFSKISSSLKKVEVTTTKPNEAIDPKDTNHGYRLWDNGNNFGEEYRDKIKKSSLPLRMFEDLVRIHYGNGLYYHKNEVRDGKLVRIPVIDKEVETFLRNNKIRLQYANIIIRDYYWWKMGAIEVVVDRARHKIIKVKAHDMLNVRWGDNNDSGIVERAVISSHWPYPKKDQISVLPVIDPLDAVAFIESRQKTTNFIYRIAELTPGNMFYPLPSWATENSMNWLEVSLYIPIFQKALLKNMVTLKYVIYIHDSFWPQRYPDWDAEPDKKTERQEETIKSIEDVLAGADKAGKFIASGYLFDDQGNEIKSIKVEEIKNEINDKAFLVTSDEANSQLMYAWGYDPTFAGHGKAGTSNLSGSGSDKMRGMQNRQIMLACDRVDTLDFMEFVSQYNGWDYSWSYEDVIPTTLDKSKDGIQKPSSSTSIE